MLKKFSSHAQMANTSSFSLVTKIDARPFLDSYITYLHFDDIVSTALRAVDTKTTQTSLLSAHSGLWDSREPWQTIKKKNSPEEIALTTSITCDFLRSSFYYQKRTFFNLGWLCCVTKARKILGFPHDTHTAHWGIRSGRRSRAYSGQCTRNVHCRHVTRSVTSGWCYWFGSAQRLGLGQTRSPGEGDCRQLSRPKLRHLLPRPSHRVRWPTGEQLRESSRAINVGNWSRVQAPPKGTVETATACEVKHRVTMTVGQGDAVQVTIQCRPGTDCRCTGHREVSLRKKCVIFLAIIK